MISNPDRLMQTLHAALGPDAATSDPARLESHQIDGVTPGLLVTPVSAEQIGAAMRLCSEAKATMIPWGGGTAMALGNPPRRADVVIKLDKLDRMIEHDPANLTVSAESGITWSALQSTLRSQKQFVPIDAPFQGRATLGGTLSANINGPRRSYYGSVRDLVIGMKVVLATGERIKAGGKVVKNVAGYDLCKLFVGSLGTLGIITEVTVRLAPAAERAATVMSRGTLAQARRFTEELSRSALLPAAVFLVSETEHKIWRVAVWCEGFVEAVERHLGELAILATRAGMSAEVVTAPVHDEFWKKVIDMPLEPDRLIYRATVPREAIFDFIERLHHSRAETVSDAVSGTVWLNFPVDKASILRFSEIESIARQRRGHAVLFAAPAPLKAAINVWGPSPTTLSLMREIKRQFDANELLNPGRFIGDL